MKKQTYITVYEDAAGKMTDFNRWSFKRAETCLKKEIDALKANSAYRFLQRDARTLKVIETPDGYNRGKTVICIDLLAEA